MEPNTDNIRRIGSNLELFVDDWLIHQMYGTNLMMHNPIPKEVVLEFNRPWEGPVSSGGSVLELEDSYKMWYGARSAGGASGQSSGSHTAYAESTDGINWKRPKLGIVDISGSKDNNVIGYDTDDTHLGGVYRDQNPNATKSEAYKALTVRRDSDGTHFIRGFTSVDGLNWRIVARDPLLVAPSDKWPIFDGEASVFWDTIQNEYVAYFRGWQPARRGTYSDLRGGVRTVRRSTSKDFLNWTQLEFISTGDAVQEHFYAHNCEPYFRAPHIYLMFPWRFVPGRRFHKNWSDHGISEILFMTSRDGINFDRRFMEAFVRPGPDLFNWGDRSNLKSRGILQTGKAELSIYYSEHYRSTTCRLRRATLRLDGFSSINAPYEAGEFVTHPLIFEGGKLVINYASSVSGGIKIEVQQLDGEPIKGYTLDDCSDIYGDEVERTVTWANSADLRSFSGSPIRLRFSMKDADLYSIRFV